MTAPASDALPLTRRALSLARNAALVVVALLVATWVGRPSPAVEAGVAAPSTIGVTVDGAAFDLRSLRGTPTVVNIWATWCPPCRAELPALSVAARRLDGRVAFVGLAVQSPVADIAAMATRYQLAYPVVRIDAETQAAWRASSVPSTYLLDRCQRVVWSIQGIVDEHVIDEAVAAHLHQEQPC